MLENVPLIEVDSRFVYLYLGVDKTLVKVTAEVWETFPETFEREGKVYTLDTNQPYGKVIDNTLVNVAYYRSDGDPPF